MELTNISNLASDYEELDRKTEEVNPEQEKPAKKVFISGSQSMKKDSFEDSFEVK